MIVTHPKNAVLDSHSKLHVACSHTSQSFRFVIVDEYNSEFADLRKIPLQAFPPRSRTSFIVSQHEHVFTLSGCLPYRSQIWDTQLHPINDGSSIVKLPKSWISVSREPTRLRRISYAVFCLKKKKKRQTLETPTILGSLSL